VGFSPVTLSLVCTVGITPFFVVEFTSLHEKKENFHTLIDWVLVYDIMITLWSLSLIYGTFYLFFNKLYCTCMFKDLDILKIIMNM